MNKWGLEMSDTLLTVIMPCYNGGETIARAIDSILCQKSRYKLEILIVDDKSTDNSLDIINSYIENHDNIRLIQHSENKGNAISFYDALCDTKTKYFCVLDVDDYYTLNSKIEEQICALENDSESQYVGVTHNWLMVFNDGSLNVPGMSCLSEYTYIDFLQGKAGYYHTSTFMYRNIFEGNPPKIFSEVRGDTVRTAVHLMFSNKKIKVLPIIASAYCWTEKGIWTHLDQKSQNELSINLFSKLKELSTTQTEAHEYQKLIDECNNNLTKKGKRSPIESMSIDEALDSINSTAGNLAYNHDYVFKSLFYSKYLDSCTASLGYIYNQNNIINKKPIDHSAIVIITTSLQPKCGGIFREIVELSNVLSDYQVYIICLNNPPIDDNAEELLHNNTGAKLLLYPEEGSKIEWLWRVYYEISPFRCYYYNSHHEYYPFTIVDTRCDNTMLFSYDHGFVGGLSISGINTIITKRITDYKVLSSKYKDRVIYIPALNYDTLKDSSLHYQPFNNHKQLITACGVARFYKLKSNGNSSYVDLIIELLSKTKGAHVHFGPIPEESLQEIHKKMEINNVPDASFIHIPWTDNPTKLMFDYNVDLFIEPFPIISYKITLDMMMHGIPIISFKGNTRISINDIIYDDSLQWSSREDFIQKCTSLDTSTLLYHSKKSVEYYKENYSIDAIKKCYVENKSYPLPKRSISFIDDNIHEMIEYLPLFGYHRYNTIKIINKRIAENKEIISEKTKDKQKTHYVKRRTAGYIIHKIVYKGTHAPKVRPLLEPFIDDIIRP